MDRNEQRKQQYRDYVEQVTPKHNLLKNMAGAFLTGGTICLLGQVILNFCKAQGLDPDVAGSWCSLLLVLGSVILRKLPDSEVREHLFLSRALPIRWLLRPSNTRKKDRSLVSDVKFSPLQDL